MTLQIPFVPHPRLEYTEYYNKMRDDYQIYLMKAQRENLENYDRRLSEYQETVRIEENRRMQELIQEMNLYTHLDRTRAYQEYKYAYWAGTLVDQYI